MLPLQKTEIIAISTAMEKHKRAQSHATHRILYLCTEKYAQKRIFQTGKLIPFFQGYEKN